MFLLCAQSIWSSMVSVSLHEAFPPSSAFLPGSACVPWLYPYLFPWETRSHAATVACREKSHRLKTEPSHHINTLSVNTSESTDNKTAMQKLWFSLIVPQKKKKKHILTLILFQTHITYLLSHSQFFWTIPLNHLFCCSVSLFKTRAIISTLTLLTLYSSIVWLEYNSKLIGWCYLDS